MNKLLSNFWVGLRLLKYSVRTTTARLFTSLGSVTSSMSDHEAVCLTHRTPREEGGGGGGGRDTPLMLGLRCRGALGHQSVTIDYLLPSGDRLTSPHSKGERAIPQRISVSFYGLASRNSSFISLKRAVYPLGPTYFFHFQILNVFDPEPVSRKTAV